MIKFKTVLLSFKFDDKIDKNKFINKIYDYINNHRFCPLKNHENNTNNVGVIIGLSNNKAVINIDPNKIDLDMIENMYIYPEILVNGDIKFSIKEC